MENLVNKIKELETTIGNTPVIKIAEGVYGKLESKNPAGSIKDRAAFYIIKDAIDNGLLKEGGTIVEATSGNTGIGLAYCAKFLGLKTILTMPESMSMERRKMLQGYGAELVLTKASEGMNGAVTKAKEIVASLDNSFFADQFGNESSIRAHYYTTAPEVFKQLPNTKYVVCGIGSGGTIMGFKKYIEENNLDCMVIGVEPEQSPLISKGIAGPHKIQGIGANFIPKIVDVNKIDKMMTVDGMKAYEYANLLYKKTMEKCGISSGAAYAAALELKAEGKEDIVAILPDGGDRYPQEIYQ